MNNLCKCLITVALVTTSANANSFGVGATYTGVNGGSMVSIPIYVGSTASLTIDPFFFSVIGTGRGPAFPPACAGSTCISSIQTTISFAGQSSYGAADTTNCIPTCVYNYYPPLAIQTINLSPGVHFLDVSFSSYCSSLTGCTAATNGDSINIAVLSGTASSTPEPATALLLLPLGLLLFRHHRRKLAER